MGGCSVGAPPPPLPTMNLSTDGLMRLAVDTCLPSILLSPLSVRMFGSYKKSVVP